MKILVVDDKAENLYLLRALLTGHGHEVDEARHGAEALVKARQSPPALIVSDLLMPVMDGYTLLRHWKADARLKDVPFVVYSATYTEPKDEQLALELGADAFILKPAEPDAFMARLAAVLAKKEAGALTPPRQPVGEEKGLLKEYSEVLIRKLEEKALQLEEANRDLTAREARLRAVIENEPECVKLLAADGSLLEMNPAGLRMLEADSLAQIQHHCLFPLVAEADRAAFRESTGRVFRGESGLLEFQITGLKGGQRWLEMHASPLRDATGKVTALLGITRDITARRQAEAGRRESEERLRLSTELGKVAVWEYDVLANEMTRSPNHDALYGLAGQGKWQAETFLDATHPEDRGPVHRIIQESLAPGGPGEYAFDFRVFRPDGVMVWLNVIGQIVKRDATGQGLLIRGCLTDITARKRIEAGWRESEERLRLALDAAQMGTFDWDVPGNRIAWSRWHEKMWGFQPGEFGGTYEAFSQRVHPEDLPAINAEVARCLAEREAFAREFRVVWPDGSVHWVQARGEFTFGAGVQPERMRGAVIDVTARRQAEATLIESERRYRALFENMAAGFVLFEVVQDERGVPVDLVILAANASFELATGLKNLSVIGQRLTRVLPGIEKDTADWIGTYGQVALTGESRQLEQGSELLGIDYSVTAYRPGPKQCAVTFVNITARKQAEESLRQSEAHLAAAQARAKIGNWELDLATGTGTWSAEMFRLFGRAPSLGPPTFAEFVAMIHPEDRESFGRQFARATSEPGEIQAQFRLVRPDGSVGWFEARTEVTFDAAERPAHLVGTVQDITERKDAEERIRQLNRTYAVLSEINQTIVREKDSQSLLDAACRIAVEKGGFRLAWIGLTDEAGGRLRIRTHSRADAATLEILATLIEAAPPTGCALTHHALETGQPDFCNDIASDARAASWREAALQRGYRAMTAFPLEIEGKVAGVLNLYAGEPGFFDAEELRLLAEMATDVGFALEVSQRETERHAAEERLARQRASLIELTSPRAIEGGDLPAALQFVTETAARTLGVARVGLWRFNRDHSAVECADLFEAAASRHSADAGWAAADHPAYFRALVEVDVLAVDDAARDPRTCELVGKNLRPPGVQSLLAVQVRAGGHLDGVLCHEHIGPPRRWTADEKTYAVALGNLVSLTLEGWERRRAETALRESEARFREIAETIEEAFWVTDPDKTRLLYISTAYETIWGRTCASLCQSPRTWLEAIHPDDRERVRLAALAQREGGDYDQVYRIRRPDGAERWIRDLAYPVRDESGEVVRVVGVARDITERRQLEEQLRQSQKMDAIGHLAGGVAHDFNNILAVIMMQVELLKTEEGVSTSTLDGLRELRTAAERAADLTRQLLLFSCKQVMQSRDLDLNESVTGLARMLRRILGEDVRLELHTHRAALWVHADPGMLDQVLMNLAVNARDAMPRGGHLRIETSEQFLDETQTRQHPDVAPGRHVCLHVSDTGSGIPPQILPRIFEPFFTTKEPGRGTGLGLATVFGIVKQHGGWIDVQSVPDKGTTFAIFLPALAADPATSGATAPTRPPPDGTETILLVEDDPTVRALTRVVLERSGYRVLEAVSGADALQRWPAMRGQAALLLTDVVMPDGVSGHALAQRLCAEQPDLKVIYMSGYSAELAGRELALRVGENFLQKPFSPDLLLETVRRCMDN